MRFTWPINIKNMANEVKWILKILMIFERVFIFVYKELNDKLSVTVGRPRFSCRQEEYSYIRIDTYINVYCVYIYMINKC
jgi:hypothetical protein